MQNGKTLLIGIIAVIFFLISFKECFNSNNRQKERPIQRQEQTRYEKSPVDVLIRNLSNEQSFSIILFDMDYFEASNEYKHQYNILIEREDSVYAQKTDWVIVGSAFFNANIENMGMEIASKKDGKVSKSAAPAGYSNYIGNEKYGEWKTDNSGNSFWSFYGKYAFMSSMFRMAMYPAYYSNWNNYRSNYHGYGRSYYGPTSNGKRMYGTNSNYAKANNNSKWNNKSTDFKSKVRNKVSRSTTSKSRVNRTSSSRSKSTYNKRTRSSSRYSGSSTRSRGGSFGK